MSQGLLVNLGLMVGVAAFAILAAVSPVAAVATAGGVVLCAGALRRLEDLPRAGLLLILAMVPVDYLTKLDGGSMTVTKLLFPVALGMLFLQRVTTGRAFAGCAQAKLVLGFAISVLLSLLLNPVTAFSIGSVQGYAGVFLLFFLTLNVVECEGDVRAMLTVLVFSCLLSAVVGMLGLSLGFLPRGILALMAPHDMRMIGLSSVNPNTFATYVLTALLLVAYLAGTDRRAWTRALLVPIVLVMGLAIVLSRSRAVSLVAATSALVLIVRIRHRVALWKVGLFVAAVAGCLLWMAPAQYFERVLSLLANPESDLSFQSRKSFNALALALFVEHPLLGVGPGNFSEYFTSPDFRFIVDTFGSWKMVHNLYLGVACHMGILGLGLFGAILWRAFADLSFVVRSYNEGEDGFLKRAAEAVQVALFSFLFNAFFLPMEREKYMWILFGVCAAMARIRRAERERVAVLPATPAEAG